MSVKYVWLMKVLPYNTKMKADSESEKKKA